MEKRASLPFHWSALLLSALAVPVPFGIVAALTSPHPLYAFALIGGLAYVTTLGILAFLFLPAVWLAGRVASVTAASTAVIGGLIALPLFVVWDFVFWKSSGVDSGPPSDSYFEHALHHWLSWEAPLVVAFGVLSAAVYYRLATRPAAGRAARA